MVGGATHAPRPLGVVVAHADLVMDGVVLLATLEDPAAVGAAPEGASLAVHSEQVLVQVAAERPPDHVVVEHALLALLGRVALQSQAAELDDRLVRPEGNRRVDA